MYSSAVVFLPLIGAFLAGIIALASWGKEGPGRERMDRMAQWITSGLLLASLAAAVKVFIDVAIGGETHIVELFTWISSGDLDVAWRLRVDTLTAVMMIVVTGVSAMVHVYSHGYMHHDKGIPRFMSYLSLFTFFMLSLITADNLLQLFFGWEGVGLASYLLIGFWYDRPAANAAAIKAFIVNRVGDFGFTLGILATFVLFGTINFGEIFPFTSQYANDTFNLFGGEVHALTVICLLLFVGAMGKSAQLGLHTWLPDAMEGPTPVSALIHAATMVTAGVFMVARLSPLFEQSDVALAVVTIIGAATAIFAATVACTQNDIKRVIAYSTCSQLGYMFFACGVSAYAAGIFHLTTHAFFKALLFLGAGSVIHAMSDEQDMRKMGGLWKHIKVTYVLMFIGSYALIGLPPFSGFFSKDIVLEAAFAAHTPVGQLAFWLGIGAALLTAFYSTRLLIMTFHGKPRGDEVTMAHVHESPPVMILPLIPLALGAIAVGWATAEWFVGEHQFWNGAITVLGTHTALEDAHHVPTWVKLAPIVVGLLGIVVGVWWYALTPGLPAKLAERFRAIYLFLLNKWYFDELYAAIFVRPAFVFGRNLWKTGDGDIIDGIGPDGIASASRTVARRFSRLQSGYIYHYAFAMLIGIALIVTWYLFVR